MCSTTALWSWVDLDGCPGFLVPSLHCLCFDRDAPALSSLRIFLLCLQLDFWFCFYSKPGPWHLPLTCGFASHSSPRHFFLC